MNHSLACQILSTGYVQETCRIAIQQEDGVEYVRPSRYLVKHADNRVSNATIGVDLPMENVWRILEAGRALAYRDWLGRRYDIRVKSEGSASVVDISRNA
ncbi:hypothetical protein [Tranquillimonas alkanivorans]|uniref:Uncharacterized protein n=1 Tax=Tranquillimonas alkanivorans TaxID=441119 RepID=A0A1I5UXW6_9RHOB|nr:hypothetical protein [Tranquillimonas alkanivorans]SFQ00174.1 hypothetical protein SAMN04488047_12519 [Tranquillimonas alkanivorans]